MIVIDGSALVEWLLDRDRAPAVAEQLREQDVHALDFTHLEVISGLRRRLAAGEIDADRGWFAVDDLRETPLEYHPAAPFAWRAWELRDSHTPYDAAYIALAEGLDAPLVTTDARLARSTGHRAEIVEAGSTG
jgi:predicted nucleic acid-binding protein